MYYIVHVLCVVGHYSTLMKQLSNEKIPPLHSQVLLPHQVSSEKDNELEVSSLIFVILLVKTNYFYRIIFCPLW